MENMTGRLRDRGSVCPKQHKTQLLSVMKENRENRGKEIMKEIPHAYK